MLLANIAEADLALNIDCTPEAMERLEMHKSRLEELRKIKMEGIVARSRARWYESGERSTSYFLGLEKRSYVNKLIPAVAQPGGG